MSYILDALRKSDQQRRRGVVPTLLTAQIPAATPTRSAFLIYGPLAAVLVCLGILIGWLRPWQSEQPASVAGSIVSKSLESSARHSATPLRALPEMAEKPARELLEHQSNSAGTPATAHANTAIKRDMLALPVVEMPTTPFSPAIAVPTKAAVSVPGKRADTSVPDTVQEQKVIPMAELPVSIQQDIPGMSISVHAYSSSPKDRLVSINGQLLREGGYLAPGLRLEQITHDGMIFSFKGYRFHHGAQDSGLAAGTR